MRRNSRTGTGAGGGSSKTTVQLLHDVVDSMKKQTETLHSSPGEECSNIELEHALNMGIKDFKSKNLEISNKISKKFKKKTIQAFNAKRFDIEKAELKSK